MNAANLRRVADAMEQGLIAGLGYNQATWVAEDHIVPDNSGNECGTTACIAGWAYAVSIAAKTDRDILSTAYGWYIQPSAAKYLELTAEEACRLFRASPLSWVDDTIFGTMQRHAIRTLRYAADHDVIDWDAANPAEAR